MDSPSHFFSDSVDLDGPVLFEATPDRGADEDGLDVQPLMLIPPGTPGPAEAPAVTATKPQGPRLGEWGSGAMDAELFVEPNFGKQDMPKIKQEENDKIEEAITVAPPTSSSPSTRRASSTKSTASQRLSTSESVSTSVTPPPPPPFQSGAKKRKAQAAFIEEECEEDEKPAVVGEKRQRFLERNRVAATKCRQKKKQWIAEMEEKSLMLENHKAFLESQRDQLLEEIKGLKYLLMMHAKCNEPSIDGWLKGEAQRYIAGQNEHLVQYPPLLPPSYGYAGPPDAVSQSSPIVANAAYPGSELDAPSPLDRRGSIAYSHTSTVQTTSPIDAGFPPMASPRFKIEEGEEGINLDHMPDSMFCSDQPFFLRV
ncbi:hypothetical protein GQ53DRAFT_767286 [Thozetella sp. PMI_491]|nr:hypothetical protein GQ53DRAFT_767286 [Thozetella sp. PMI_491]